MQDEFPRVVPERPSESRIPAAELEAAFGATNGIPGRTVPPKRPTKPTKRAGIFWLILGGVVLPIVTLTIELVTHQCAQVFFDPIPTLFHVLAVALVPISNLLIAHTLRHRAVHRLKWLAPLQGASIAVALAYAAVYAPLMPMAFIALAMLGWGLLPLTPFLATISSFAGLVKLQTVAREEGQTMPRIWPAALLALAVLAFPIVHRALTISTAAMAMSPDSRTASRGLWLTRAFGSEDALLRHAYGDSGSRNLLREMTVADSRLTTDQARHVYYRVTGKAFNAVPAPTNLTRGGQPGFGSWNFDANLGGTQVANRVPGLSLSSSRLDAKADAAAGTSYTEWTMVFKNVAANASEARAQVELPPGAAVSRLTLWIDGQPQEAAFGGRAQVRAAYQEIAVVQRRDPVLVTTSGPNRVLMQCFPVPPNGGEMKIRMGITSPMRIIDAGRSEFALPRLLEWNFEQATDVRHELWLEADGPIASDGTAGSATTLKQRLSDADLSKSPGFRVQRPTAAEIWTDDPTDPTFAIRQVVRPRKVPAPPQIVFLFDGSISMRSHLKALATDAIKACPSGAEIALVFAGDDVEKAWEGFRKVTPTELEGASDWLRGRRAVGGRENLTALLEAWDLAASRPGSAIVWVHGTQPILSSGIESLLQRKEREKTPPTIYNIAVEAGPNRIIEQLDGFAGLRSVRSGGNPSDDLKSLLSLWNGSAMEWVAERERLPRPEAFDGLAKADKHLARLWATEEVERLRVAPETGSLDKAVKLALEMRVVTPVSGAVVLERAEQYARHGLEQGDPAESPTVPEPGSATILACAVAAFLGSRRFRGSSRVS